MALKRKRSALDTQKVKKPKLRAGDREDEVRITSSWRDSNLTWFQAPPTLLTIPKELRDQIYEEVLLEPDDQKIDISDKNTKPPGILSVCTQTREEARELWLYENRFEVTVTGCNAYLLAKFGRAFEGCEGRRNISIKPIQGDRDWLYLVEWCRKIHAYELATEIVSTDDDDDKYFCVVSTAHHVARSHRGRSWTHCRYALELVRPAFGAIDKMWLRD